ncbi:uncharacterized protein SCHCODRAFT_02590364 [Schizophyllum commune H4-8]|nr:uncharacterized protein SCHCODRAFT_02590364 [Schizophyllum commune H4-8]KAI5886945.1 hypothetical protein SCHCODRAFT_02590364 [Schizophyllum commune H4-8]
MVTKKPKSVAGADRRQHGTGKGRQKTAATSPLNTRRSPRLLARLVVNDKVTLLKPPLSRHDAPVLRARVVPRNYASSSTSSDPPSPRPTLANYDSNREYSPSESGDQEDNCTADDGSTPRKKIFLPSRRPGNDELAAISPKGHACIVTLEHNGNGTVENCHLLDRACGADPDIVEGMEIIMVMERGTLDVDCPTNRVFLESKMHTAFDNGRWVLLPTVRDLRRMLSALRRQKLAPIEGQKQSPPRNSMGFTHHKDVFPNAIRKVDIAPLSCWADGLKIYRERYVGCPEPAIMYGPQPFEKPLPTIDVHCNLYYVVWKAYKTLQDRNIHAHARYSVQERLVRQIGQIMWAYTRQDDK